MDVEMEMCRCGDGMCVNGDMEMYRCVDVEI